MKTLIIAFGSEPALRRIGRLDPTNQEVLIWRHGLFGEPRLSHQQIARRMNLRPGTVRVLEQRALHGVLAGTNGEVA